MKFRRFCKDEASEYNVIGLLMMSYDAKGDVIFDMKLGDDDSPISILRFLNCSNTESLGYRPIPMMN